MQPHRGTFKNHSGHPRAIDTTNGEEVQPDGILTSTSRAPEKSRAVRAELSGPRLRSNSNARPFKLSDQAIRIKLMPLRAKIL
jgi:hypothetical protein